MNLNILTFTMSNITVNEFFVQSPSIVCSIEIHDQGHLICNVTRYWVEKGKGNILILFNNNCDFRTVIQIDIAAILVSTVDKICEISTVNSASIYDNIHIMKECEPYIFKEIWHLCNDGILVDGHVFRLSEFRVSFDIENTID
jgi:hypothetical protein